MTTAVETRNKELAKTAWGYLESMKKSIGAVLPRHLTPERMATIAFTAMRRNPKLMECSRESIIGSIMQAAMLGLEPSGPLGHGALIPYKGECQFQPMYQGLLDLARRSGFVKDVQCRAVYQGDHYKYRFGLDPDIEHVPMEGEGADNPDRACTHVYAIIRLHGGGIQWDQMSYAQAIAHAKRFSQSWNTRDYPGKFKPGSPWAEHPVPMAMKTILKAVLKLCPKSPEMAVAMDLDDARETGRNATITKTAEFVDIDVDFGDAPAIAETSSADAPKSGLDNLVAREANAGAQEAGNKAADQSQTASGGGAQAAPGPVDPEARIGSAEWAAIEKVQQETKVAFSSVEEFIKKTFGYKRSQELQQKNLKRVLAFVQNGGKDVPDGWK